MSKKQTDNKKQTSQITLVLDSSSTPLTIALNAHGKTYTAKTNKIKQEEFLFPLLRRLLKKADIKLAEVKKVFFVKGPGRFTGIRIGITLASMLSELAGADIASASIFDLLKFKAAAAKEYKTWLAKNPDGNLAVILHAFRGEYFVQIGQNAPVWIDVEELKKLLKKTKKPLFIVGWGADRTPLADALPAAYTYGPVKLNFVDAKPMLAYAAALPDTQNKKEVL
ncbi:MAG: tRNA (adenosine(37)-N6)-threonylcarbamoyltransferase complex dimerization subunit type 1 TsaB, partial [Elusimicrobiota bacterium]|nr:tRNA (adenosine(37)-N6)-threonylcarbamoyltransferase complex dimerization subunit type 1 TsaB [Elusimicrobiota bacterium]